VDSGSDFHAPADDEANHTILFTLIQQAIEASLLTLPLNEDESSFDQIDGSFNAPRERLALKLIDTESLEQDDDLAALSHIFTDQWLKERSDDLSKITKNWQRALRLSIGASFDLVRQRLCKELKEASAQYFISGAKEAAPILSRYITGVLDELIDDSLQLWVPIAAAFEAQGRDGPRLPTDKINRISIAIDPALRPALRADETIAAPEVVFAAAAAWALEHQDVAAGVRFADLAVRADKVARSRDAATKGYDLELRYLLAVAFRMQILSVGTHLTKTRAEGRRADLVKRGTDLVKTLYGRASALIEQCIVTHVVEKHSPDERERGWHSERLLRGLSERASLNMFTAASFGLAAQGGPSPLIDDWNRYLALAQGDLKRCIELDDETTAETPVIRAVRAQFVPNLAAYDVMAHVLNPDEPPPLQTWPRKEVRRIWDFWGEDKHIHPLLRAELTGFAQLRDASPPQGAAVRPKSHLDDHRVLTLPLDRALYRAIYRDLPIPRPSRG
jgi:hypothetical protein